MRFLMKSSSKADLRVYKVKHYYCCTYVNNQDNFIKTRLNLQAKLVLLWLSLIEMGVIVERNIFLPFEAPDTYPLLLSSE